MDGPARARTYVRVHLYSSPRFYIGNTYMLSYMHHNIPQSFEIIASIRSSMVNMRGPVPMTVLLMASCLLILTLPPLAQAIVCPSGYVRSLYHMHQNFTSCTPGNVLCSAPAACFSSSGRVPSTSRTCATLVGCHGHAHCIIFRLPPALHQYALH